MPEAKSPSSGGIELAPAQRSRLEAFKAPACVDVHCHCLPGVDDGAADLNESLSLCRALVDDGVTVVVATPHQLGRYQGRNSAAEVRQAVAVLAKELHAHGVPLRVLPGGDVRLDERMESLLAENRILTVGDRGHSVLLELPDNTFIDPLPILHRLLARGIRPVITHPERNRFVTGRPEVIEPWLAQGAVLQITSGSFTGDFGSTAQRAAWFWLETGKASVVASDAHHAVNRPPRMTDAIKLIQSRFGGAVARRVCIENPIRLLRGGELEAAPVRPQEVLDLET